MRFLLCLIALVFAVPELTRAQAVVTGRVLSHDGKPLSTADVALVSNASRFPRSVLDRYAVAPNGAFSISLRAPAVHRLRFSGLYHAPFEWPIYVEERDTLRTEIRLGAYALPTDQLELSYATDMGAEDQSWTQASVTERDSDGDFVVSIPAKGDTVGYSLAVRGTPRGGRTAGPTADRYVLNREGEYYALIASDGASAITVSLSPNSFPSRPTQPTVKLLQAADRSRQFASIAADSRERRNAHRKRSAALRAAGKSSHAITDDWSTDLEELLQKWRSAEDPFARQAWTMAYLWAGSAQRFQHDWTLDKRLAQEILDDVPPDSPLWSFVPHGAGMTISAASKTVQAEPYVEGQPVQPRRVTWSDQYARYVQALTNHPDSSAAPHWLMAAVDWSHNTNNFETLSRAVGRLLESYGDTLWGDMVRSRFRPKSDIVEGRPVPDFDFPLLEDPDRRITRDDLLGQPYILSFWATWCGPCRPKIETLAKADSVYGDDGLRILSVSIDFDREQARAFREEAHPMPWLNAFIKDWQPNEGALADFEISAIPYGLLVDERGQIVAIDDGSETFLDEVVLLMEER